MVVVHGKVNVNEIKRVALSIIRELQQAKKGA